MKLNKQLVLKLIPAETNAPAFRETRELAMEDQAVLSAVSQTVAELYATWSVRLWNSTLQGRRIIGLRDFVRVLARMDRRLIVRQITVVNFKRSALLFTDDEGEQVLGAIVAPRVVQGKRQAPEPAKESTFASAPYFVTASH